MKNFPPSMKLSFLILLCGGLKLAAQEVTFLGGVLTDEKFAQTSATWQIDYRQDFYSYFAGSIAYINEGHLPGHHRDGTAWEAWGRLPFSDDRFSISLGAGIYYFYDTQSLPNGDSADVHGTAPIFSLSATGYLADRWFYQFRLNQISPSREHKVTTLTAGAGFWFGRGDKPTASTLGDASAEDGYVTENELTVFAGQSVVNTFLSQKAKAFAGEYRRGLFPHVDWTASAIYEGDPQIIRRSGVATQLWFVNTFFNKRIAFGGGLGPYFFLDHKHPASAGKKNPAAIAPLASITCSVRLSDHWIVRAIFDRVTSSYNRDSDIFLRTTALPCYSHHGSPQLRKRARPSRKPARGRWSPPSLQSQTHATLCCGHATLRSSLLAACRASPSMLLNKRRTPFGPEAETYEESY
jgi:hypothetical protein